VGAPVDPLGVSPYRTTLEEFVRRYATSDVRKVILGGFLEHRRRLAEIGLVGMQWVDGSFVENVENTQNRPPEDVDVVTFHGRPSSMAGNQAAWASLVNDNLELFMPTQSKVEFRVDAYFVDISLGPANLIKQTAYWFGLFSHKRLTSQWKGLLEIPIDLAETVRAQLTLASL
jgi:hypothetical protein